MSIRSLVQMRLTLTVVLLTITCLLAFPTAAGAKESSARQALKKFLAVCEAGNVQDALDLCDYQIGDGNGVVPAEPQVRNFIRFLNTRTPELKSEGPSGEYTQFIFRVREDGSQLVINMKPFKGGKWLITAINMRG